MTASRRQSAAAFAAITALFFAWGFISAHNDPLVAALRRVFALSYTEALLTQIAFFVAFATVSLPAAALLGRLGARRTILAALAVMALGCLVIQATALAAQFAVVLAGLFLLAAGIVALQVAANPLAAALGDPERSHFRLTLAHSFNALGFVCGGYAGAQMMLGADAGLGAVRATYLIVIAIVLGLGLVVVLLRHRIGEASLATEAPGGGIREALRSRWALAGAAAIALYVGAEVTVGTMLILYLASPEGLGLPLEVAGTRVALFYWGGALVGRFLASAALTIVPARHVLALAAAAAVALSTLGIAVPGAAGAWCLLGIGLFNSVMFPTIFGLTLERTQAPRAATSGLLCLAIGCGAPLPLLAGQIADRIAIGWAFAVPLAGYALILAFARAASRSGAAEAPREAHVVRP